MSSLKKNVHKPGHFQYTIHYEGKSFSCPRTQKGFPPYYMHFSSFKICSQFVSVSVILHHIPLLRLLPKSYFMISTFQPNYLCSSSFNIWWSALIISNFVYAHNDHYIVTRMLTYVCEYRSTQYNSKHFGYSISYKKLIISGK